MTQVFHLPENIRSEFSIDESGKAYASQSAVARLCGVRQQSINELLEKIATGKSLSESLNPLAGNDYRATGKIQDIAIAAIINHYSMYARNTTEQAKKASLAFQAIGIRSWIKEELGWKEPPSTLSLEDAIALANMAAESSVKAGVDVGVSEQLKLEGLMKTYPSSKEILKPQKDAIAASNPLPDKPLTPTEIGQELAVRLGYVSISAKKVNRKLLELGYQTSITRIKRSNSKEVHDYYKATEKGKPHSTLLMATYLDGDGKGTKAQLRWYSSIVLVLQKNWQE